MYDVYRTDIGNSKPRADPYLGTYSREGGTWSRVDVMMWELISSSH